MAHVEEHLLAYLDGELSPAEVQSVEAHLARCAACRAALDELQSLQAGLTRTIAAAYATTRLAPAAEQRIRSALAAERARQASRGPQPGWWQALQLGLRSLLRPLTQAAIPAMALFFVVLTLNASRLPYQAGAQELLVLGQSTFTPGSTAAVRVAVRDNASGQPLANARVDVSLRQAGLARTVFAGNTDATGSLPVQFRVPEEWQGDAELVVEADSDLGAAEVTAPIRLARTYRLLLSSDRPVYRPGETVHLRTLALGAVDQRPAADALVRFEAFDPQGAALLGQEVRASDFGIAAVDLALAADAPEGAYRLRAVLGDTVSERTVQVSQADLPAFRVDVRADQPFYLSGQAVAGTVDAAYFFGRPVADAAVTLRVLVSRPREAADAADPVVVRREVTGRTDAAGRFSFRVELPELPAAFFAARQPGEPETTLALDLEATVVDSLGQSEFGWQKLALARQPILIAAVPEGGTLRSGVENLLFILTSYPDGQPTAATLQVQIGDAAPMPVVTSAAGIAEVRYTPRQGDVGARTLRITAADAAGREARAELTLPLDRAREVLLLRTDRAIYAVGDTAAVEALSAGPASAVFLDVIKAGQLVLTQSAPVQDGKATFALDLTPELAGTLELNAYAVGSDSRALRDSRVIVVDAPEALRVELATDRPEYRPGEEAILSAQVQSAADGRPVEAALGLAVVNEATFAQRDYQPGFARAYFLLDEALREAGVAAASSLEQAQQQIARASWAAYTGQPYTLAVQAVDTETPSQVNRARVAAFSRLSLGLGLASIAAAAALSLVVLAGLRREGLLGRAAARSLATLLVLSVVGAGLAALLGRLSGAAAWAALVVSGGLWLLALAALGAYAWRRGDGRAQYAVLLTLAFGVGLGLLAYAAGQGGELSSAWVAALGIAFGAAVVSWLLLGWGLRLEGRRSVGAMALAIALLLVLLALSLPVVGGAGGRLMEQVTAPVAGGLPGSLLAGCAAPLRPGGVSPMVAEQAAESTAQEAPEMAPQAAAPPAEEARVAGEETPGAPVEAVMAPAQPEAEATVAAAAVEETAEVQALAVVTDTLAMAAAPGVTVTAAAEITPTLPVEAETPTPTETAEPEATAEPTPERALAHAAAGETPSPTAVPAPTLEPTATSLPTPQPTATPLPTPPAPAAAVEPALPAPVIGLEAFGLGRRSPEPADPDALAQLPIVRERFPQTLYWNPQAITGPDGRLQLSLPTGDAITTWRITALAVDRSGRLGSAVAPLRVFQPFFLGLDLPTSQLAVGQETIVGVQIFNYSAQPLAVSLTGQTSPGIAAQLAADRITVPANEVALVPLRLRGLAAGAQTLVVVAQGNDVKDARQATITVTP
ncbi:MAG: MG2 domain-containing protein [Caldilineales bacterium]|nr:MG2 domain-containing protein [Caldilineales bacterium]MDW8317775.1 MG2 domain-containing protein [Anaerolineae bacterium]